MKILVCLCFFLWVGRAAVGAPPTKVSPDGIKFEITRYSKRQGLLHWKLSNESTRGVFVYDFFLLGPAHEIESSPGKLIFDTSATKTIAACPPNRTVPVLLMLLRSGGVLEGDFVEPTIKRVVSKKVSLKIAVGPEPYSVVTQAQKYFDSDCAHSPYDAVVEWATFIESNAVHVP